MGICTNRTNREVIGGSDIEISFIAARLWFTSEAYPKFT